MVILYQTLVVTITSVTVAVLKLGSEESDPVIPVESGTVQYDAVVCR